MKPNRSLIKFSQVVFFILIFLSLLAPIWTFKDLLFPYVTSKAFYFRIAIEAAFPFYLFLILSVPSLRPKWKDHQLNLFAVLFLAFSIVSSFTGVGVTRSLWGNFERMGGAFYLAHLTALYFYILALGQMGGSYLKNFLNCFLGVALVITINGIFGKLGLPTLVQDPSLPMRVSSTLGNPIYLGSYLIVPLFLAAFLGKQSEETGKKIFYYFSSFLFLVGIILSNTRGAMVGLIGGIFLGTIIYLIFTPNKKVKFICGAAAVSFVALYVVLSFNVDKLPSGDLQRLFKLRDSNTEARLVQWKVALRGYKDYPIFGVGPENYYIIANTYYNPEIFKYDRSWFDKPHNYLIEILVTTGIFGFAAYLGMLFFVGWAFYLGYKKGFLSLFEFSVLTSGLLAYQIQNMTVFDTVPASLTFYSFMGFAAYILFSTRDVKKKADIIKSLDITQTFTYAASGMALVAMIYVIYIANIIPMQIGSYVNYGFAYAGVDPIEADEYFQKALNLPFNFDYTQTAQKYSEFTNGFVRRVNPAYLDLANKFTDESIVALKNAMVYEDKYPILWNDLALAYLFQDYKPNQLTMTDERTTKATAAAQRAIDLVPGRQEGYLTMAQVKAVSGQFAESEQILQDLSKRFPTDSAILLQLSNIARLRSDVPRAIALLDKAKANGYTPASYSDVSWLVDYYISQKNYDKALEIINKYKTAEPNNISLFIDLAGLDVKMGNFTEAKNLAQTIMTAVTSTEPQMKALLEEIAKAEASGKNKN